MPAHRSSELPRMAEARPALMQRTGCDGQADTPTKVTLAGWRAVLRAVASRFSKDRVMDEAASVAFYTLLALFPALAALVALYGLVANPSGLFSRLDLVPSLVPNWGVQILQQVLRSLTARSRHTLGLGLGVSLVTALWSSNRGIRSLFRALNAVHGVREERGFLHFTAVTLGFTAGALVLMVVALAGVIALPIVLARVGYAGTGTWLLRVLRWPLLMAATEAFLTLVYRYGPYQPAPRRRWLTPGSVFAAIAWMLGSICYSWFVAHLARYDVTYGSLGAVIGFMTWVWLSAIVLLVGAELDAEVDLRSEHRRGTDARARSAGMASGRQASGQQGE